MRKRNLAARNKRRSVRLCGICLGLAMAASGCGADGRQYNMAEEAGIQNVQDEQKAQDTETARDGQEAQDTETAQDEQETTGTQKEEEVREQVLAGMTDEQKNWMGGLSREQRLADFESLCDGLRGNYPYVKLAKRQEGADLDALEVSYREKVGQCANDNAFLFHRAPTPL